MKKLAVYFSTILVLFGLVYTYQVVSVRASTTDASSSSVSSESSSAPEASSSSASSSESSSESVTPNLNLTGNTTVIIGASD
ncbi:hypothetical protein SIN07_00725 [Pediococcus inopinatus]|uniref:Extracellular protein n=1 Tax=Pediococcus inopinatus TaxID=114090 RepID=A0ABZ0Q669_9LACO|nr:hypothetical protein [Pediococcus inopinatus]AVL00748.1 hypothetical protein PI20285_08900 [Pediococcus inopinatus]WPC16939.1 hypothetical protein N6G94_07045 [Pediococcus inopinatus]WPC19943.1 hypothetical protein N6G95_01740 [Pediococcus inopinatus]WPC21643.1 hypothetical protein N6G96_10345 [Pediococcus inopinatus]WPP09426.1 hypothetical protein SIN07_00725 [Pediococcus inopinatus]